MFATLRARTSMCLSVRQENVQHGGRERRTSAMGRRDNGEFKTLSDIAQEFWRQNVIGHARGVAKLYEKSELNCRMSLSNRYLPKA